MPTNTYVALDKVTLSSNGGPIVFSNIPQTYTDLRIVLSGGFVDSGFLIGARVGNGSVDTGANYSYTTVRGNGSSATSYRKSNMVFGAFCQQGGNNLNNVITVDFLNYSNTTTYKTWISRYGNAGEGTDAGASLWRSTAAITTISIAECGDGGSGSFNYGNMLSGTTVSLYGIKAQPAYAALATGGTITYTVGYAIHTFTGSGTFTPSVAIPNAQYLIVAGGGGGGSSNGTTGGGGGGAGGLLVGTTSFTTSPVSITVGGAGAGGSGAGSGTAGTASSFNALSATGGGYGGGTNSVGGNGGSGGGGGTGTGSPLAGGTRVTGQGFAGGSSAGEIYGGGGGGGAGAVGSGGGGSSFASGGDGGVGTISTITGSSVYYAGGGGGGFGSGVANGGPGGAGGGGTGGGNQGNPSGGTANTGGGGGGGTSSFSANSGVAGGSGIVIIKYAI